MPTDSNPDGGSRDVFQVVRSIKQVLKDPEAHAPAMRHFERGSILIQEGEMNDAILVLLDGIVQLSKRVDEEEIQVGMMEPGDLVGVVSFYTAEPAFSTVRAKTAVSALCLTRAEFDRLSVSNPELHRLLQPLIINNLLDRYRRIVQLHIEVALLTRELEAERNQLQDALTKLRQTQGRLIHQEKMATLGQLVAGIAHEINNPASALLRSVENLIDEAPDLIRRSAPPERAAVLLWLLNEGLKRSPMDTTDQRARMRELERRCPNLPRSLIRTLAQLGDEGLKHIGGELAEAVQTQRTERLEDLLVFFDVGTFLRSIQVSAGRIGSLVKSLKSYGRQADDRYEAVDLRGGIRDTLLILGNRLRKINVELDLPDIPPVRCQVGEINQVWTNIVMNACDAMEETGTLKIECGTTGDREVWVSFTDTGPGIRPEHMDLIFQPDFTTKTASGNYGLGLGLAISNGIVQKHGGRILAENVSAGGAKFTVFLPVSPDR